MPTSLPASGEDGEGSSPAITPRAALLEQRKEQSAQFSSWQHRTIYRLEILTGLYFLRPWEKAVALSFFLFAIGVVILGTLLPILW